MHSKPLISIIIPCYNLGNFLSPCLDSINKQKVREIEYIFVDDGSTDSTPEILDNYCADKPTCKVIHQNNSGVSSARNTAMKHCHAKYIYLLDGDDFLTDNATESMIETIRDCSADLVLSPVVIKKQNNLKSISLGIPVGHYTPDKLFKECKVFPTMPKLLYKREIIENAGLRFNPDLKVGEVYDFTIRFLTFAHSITVVPDIFFYYVMRESSATHKPDFEKDLTVLETIHQYYKYGEQFSKYASFNITAFKMMMSFTYNKYVKLKLDSNAAFHAVSTLLSDSVARNCINNAVHANGGPIKERLLAIYVKTTGVQGYRFFSKLF